MDGFLDNVSTTMRDFATKDLYDSEEVLKKGTVYGTGEETLSSYPVGTEQAVAGSRPEGQGTNGHRPGVQRGDRTPGSDAIRPANTEGEARALTQSGEAFKNEEVSPNESVGADPAWFDVNTWLQYEHGTIPEGENPVRPDDLPKRDYTGGKVSETARTVKGAKATLDNFCVGKKFVNKG